MPSTASRLSKGAGAYKDEAAQPGRVFSCVTGNLAYWALRVSAVPHPAVPSKAPDGATWNTDPTLHSLYLVSCGAQFTGHQSTEAPLMPISQCLVLRPPKSIQSKCPWNEWSSLMVQV